MKTQRRQQQQSNELADSLESFFQQLAPYGNWIVGGIILLVAGIFAIQYYSGQQQVKNEQAWNAYYNASAKRELKDGPIKLSPSRLSGIAKAHAGTVAGLWAELRLADLRLKNGIELMFTDPSEGRSELNKAQTNYESVLNGAKKLSSVQAEPLLKKATMGLGQTYETYASGDDIKQALEYYREVQTKWPGDGYAMRAKARIESLESDQELGEKSFYAEFEGWAKERIEAQSNQSEPPTNLDNSKSLDKLLEKVVPPDPTPPGESEPEDPAKTKPDAEKPASEDSKPTADGDADQDSDKDAPEKKKPESDQEGTPPTPPKP